VYWFDEVTPAGVARCNAVVDQGCVDLEVWFNRMRNAERSWETPQDEWRFPYRFIPIRGFGPIRTHIPTRELRDARPDLLVHDFDRPWFLFGFLAAKVHAARTAFRVLPRVGILRRREWRGELAKHFMFRAVDGAKVFGPDGAAHAREYGLPIARTTQVTQTVDVPHFAAARAMSTADRHRARTQAGLRGCVFLYAGRLVRAKGVDVLLEAYEAIRDDHEASLLLVGDGADESEFREVAAKLPNVVLTGFVQPSELPAWFALADALVFPTRGDGNGLVVEEAFAAGLPVISTNQAGNIRRRVDEGVNGYVVAADQADLMAARMAALAGDPTLRQRLSGNTAGAVARMHHEEYARDFDTFVSEAIARPRRRTLASALATGLGLLVALVVRGSSQPVAARAPIPASRRLCESEHLSVSEVTGDAVAPCYHAISDGWPSSMAARPQGLERDFRGF
jgi:glycosyltransferase involved in cell wall biosynthesis